MLRHVVFVFAFIALDVLSIGSRTSAQTTSAAERTIRHVLGRNATEDQIKQAVNGFEDQKRRESQPRLVPVEAVPGGATPTPPKLAITPIATSQPIPPKQTSSGGKSVFKQIGRLIAICARQWRSGKCIIDVRDPNNPVDGSNDKQITDMLASPGEAFTDVSIPTAFPTDPPSPTPAEQRVQALKSAIDDAFVGNANPPENYVPNPELETALHDATAVHVTAPADRSLIPNATPTPSVIVRLADGPYGSAELDFETSVTAPAFFPSDPTAVQFGAGICSTAVLKLNLILSGHLYQPDPITVSALDVEGALADGSKPSLTVTPTIFGKTGSALVKLSSNATLEYNNASVASFSQDLCGITEPFQLLTGINITAQLQCEISAGYGAYVDANVGVQRLLVTPVIRAYLIGSIDTSFFGNLIEAKAAGRYNVIDAYGNAGLYARPVHDFAAGANRRAVFLAMAPYTYASANTGESLITFTVSALSKSIVFVVGLTPARTIAEFPAASNANGAGYFYAISTPLHASGTTPGNCTDYSLTRRLPRIDRLAAARGRWSCSDLRAAR